MMVQLVFSSFCSNDSIHIHEKVIGEFYRTFEHTHDFYEFFLTLSGDIIHHINGNEYLVAQNSLCLVNPSDRHCFRAASGRSSSKFINVAFTAELFNKAGSYLPLLPRRSDPLKPLIIGEVPEFFVTSLRYYINKLNSTSNEVLKNHIRTMIVSQALSLFLIHQSNHKTDENLELPGWLAKTVRQMQQNCMYAGGVGVMVNISGKSPAYLARSTMRYLGVSPTQFVNELRLAHAALMLRDTDCNVLQIMLECGFGNMSHFCVLFKSKFGVSPGKYRKTNSVVVEGRL